MFQAPPVTFSRAFPGSRLGIGAAGGRPDFDEPRARRLVLRHQSRDAQPDLTAAKGMAAARGAGAAGRRSKGPNASLLLGFVPSKMLE